MKKFKKIIAIILVVSMLSVFFVSCKKDEEQEELKKEYIVSMMVQNYGTIILKLDAVAAPKTVANFIKLVKEGFYNGLTFHRVMNNFMIQGGDPNADGTGGSKDKIYGEFASNGHTNPISHVRGVISMARRSDNPNSASSQFFITNADSISLDGNYAAFGYVIEGMDVVDAITEATAPYADPYSGTIYQKNKQAVISEVKILSSK